MRDLVTAEEELTLLDLLDRILDKGVVIHGDLTLSVANIDLLYVGLRVLLTSVDNLNQPGGLNKPCSISTRSSS